MRQTLHIKGMTCSDCVTHVNHALLSIPGVTESTADFATDSATIVSDGEISLSVMRDELEAAGYVLE